MTKTIQIQRIARGIQLRSPFGLRLCGVQLLVTARLEIGSPRARLRFGREHGHDDDVAVVVLPDHAPALLGHEAWMPRGASSMHLAALVAKTGANDRASG